MTSIRNTSRILRFIMERRHPCRRFASIPAHDLVANNKTWQDACILSAFKVNGRRSVADPAAELGHLHVIGMNGIRIQRAAVAKNRDETRIVRTRQMQCVKAYGKTL